MAKDRISAELAQHESMIAKGRLIHAAGGRSLSCFVCLDAFAYAIACPRCGGAKDVKCDIVFAPDSERTTDALTAIPADQLSSLLRGMKE